MDIVVQLVLVISILSLTGVFVAVGIWIILFIKEVRESVRHINDTTRSISSFTAKLNQPGELALGLFEGIKSGIEIIELARGLFNKNERKPRK